MRLSRACKALCVLACSGPAAIAAATVSLSPSVPSPSDVGAIVTWKATVSGADAAPFVYRFRVRPAGLSFRLVVDFSPRATFDWTAADYDGRYEIEVTARSRTTGETAVATAPYVMRSRAAGGFPTLVPTSHPLVLLYSAPPCDPGSRMKVRFQQPAGTRQETPYKECRAGSSMNFYVAGLQPSTLYFAYHTIDTGDSFEDGPVVVEASGPVPDLPETSVLTPAPPGSPWPILLQLCVITNPVAVNQEGRIVWYSPTVFAAMTRPVEGGYFFGIVQEPGGPWNRFVRLIDLTGMTVLETNAGRVNEQLAVLGKGSINAFHHEALRLPDGNLAVLASVERFVTDVQGPGRLNVLGDMILVFDRNLNVVWTWNSFDHLDVKRIATLDDGCNPQTCPPLDLDPKAKDWTHSNSLQQTPDGQFLLSVRDQDWVVKINYRNGEGDGKVIWRLGKDGDIRLTGGDASQWFSHQHDARYEPGSDNRIMILDNGNTRHDADPNVQTRGQVWEVDEENRTARLALNAGLPYSLALGSTQKLPNGNYWFVAGFLPDASGDSVEVDPSGRRVFAVKTRAPVYRSYRLPDMYGTVE